MGEWGLGAGRGKAGAALGGGFDLRAFHDMILGAAALPMDLLQVRAEAWIAARLAG